MFDPRRMPPTEYPQQPPGGYPPQPARRPKRRPHQRPWPQRRAQPAYGAQSGYLRSHFSRMRGVSTPPGYTRDGGRLTPIPPKQQIQFPLGGGLGGGTEATEWGLRKGYAEAGKRGVRQLGEFYQRRGLTGAEGPEMEDWLSNLAVREGEEIARIRERYQNQLMQMTSGQMTSGRKMTGGVSVHRKGYAEEQEREASEAEAKNRAYQRWLEEQYYKEFQGGGGSAY